VETATVVPGKITSMGKSSSPDARKYIIIDQELERVDCNDELLPMLDVTVVRTGESGLDPDHFRLLIQLLGLQDIFPLFPTISIGSSNQSSF